MKRTVLFIASIGVILFQACATLKPAADSISEPDYNQRITVSNPQYKIVPSAIGYASSVLLPVAGAVGGTFLPVPMVYQDGEQVHSKVGGAILGGLLGLGVTAISNDMSSFGSFQDAEDHTQWLKKAGGDDFVILDDNELAIRLIHKSAESNYIVKNLDDVRDFASAFPASLYSESVFNQAFDKTKRKDIPELISLLPGDFNKKAKKSFIMFSSLK